MMASHLTLIVYCLSVALATCKLKPDALTFVAESAMELSTAAAPALSSYDPASATETPGTARNAVENLTAVVVNPLAFAATDTTPLCTWDMECYSTAIQNT